MGRGWHTDLEMDRVTAHAQRDHICQPQSCEQSSTWVKFANSTVILIKCHLMCLVFLQKFTNFVKKTELNCHNLRALTRKSDTFHTNIFTQMGQKIV